MKQCPPTTGDTTNTANTRRPKWRLKLRAAVRSASERQSQGDGSPCPLQAKPGASHRARTLGDKPSGKRGFAVGLAVVVPLRHVPGGTAAIPLVERCLQTPAGVGAANGDATRPNASASCRAPALTEACESSPQIYWRNLWKTAGTSNKASARIGSAYLAPKIGTPSAPATSTNSQPAQTPK